MTPQIKSLVVCYEMFEILENSVDVKKMRTVTFPSKIILHVNEPSVVFWKSVNDIFKSRDYNFSNSEFRFWYLTNNFYVSMEFYFTTSVTGSVSERYYQTETHQ